MVRRVSRRLALTALVAALLLAGCGSDGGDKTTPKGFGGSSTTSETASASKYPAPVVQNFMKSCTAQAGATTSYCRCTIEELQRTLPYDDFKSADAAIQKGGKAPSKARAAINAAIKKCRK
jgi:ABC-type glycerol-3-phosphate transport system substrate-binding protein